MDSNRYMDWHNKAMSDLKSAKILFQYGDDYGIVAFHCQQALEKLLKSLWLKHTNTLIEGHNLVGLCKTVSKIEPSIKQQLKDCAYINQFYIETRYPADVPINVDEDEAEECIEITERMFSEIVV